MAMLAKPMAAATAAARRARAVRAKTFMPFGSS
jgi:hypothetical protein